MAKVKSRKRSASTSSCVSDSGSHKSSDEEEYRKRLKKLKKKIKKEERKAAKLLKKELRSEKKTIKKQKAKRKSLSEFPSQDLNLTEGNQDNPSTNVPLGLMERSKAMAPMTKEEWEKRQSIIRRVKDEETGRYRLIKGDGEVLEEIVSKERHKEINRLATKADGDFFQSQTVDK